MSRYLLIMALLKQAMILLNWFYLASVYALSISVGDLLTCVYMCVYYHCTVYFMPVSVMSVSRSMSNIYKNIYIPISK